MKHERISPVRRKAVNLSINTALVAEARALGINVSSVCEDGLTQALSKARGEQWVRENKAAMQSWNTWIEENGLPLEEYRQF